MHAVSLYADAAVERWASFVGVPADTSRHVSFLMFSDPRFTQLYSILEGLDYSFPRASKLGACHRAVLPRVTCRACRLRV